MTSVRLGFASVIRCAFVPPSAILHGRTHGITSVHWLSDAACDPPALEAMAREAVRSSRTTNRSELCMFRSLCVQLATQSSVAVIASLHALSRALTAMSRRKDEAFARPHLLPAPSKQQPSELSAYDVSSALADTPAVELGLTNASHDLAAVAVRASTVAAELQPAAVATLSHSSIAARDVVQLVAGGAHHAVIRTTPLLSAADALAAAGRAAAQQNLPPPKLPGRGGTSTSESMAVATTHAGAEPASQSLLPSDAGAADATSAKLHANEKALLAAAQSGDVGDIATAVARVHSTVGCRVDARDPDSGASALHHFVVSLPAQLDADTCIAGIALFVDISPNSPSGNGSTPLHWAAGAGNAAAVTELLRLGADPGARTYTWRRQVFGRGSGQTPLHWAAESNHAKVVELLSAHMLFPTQVTDERAQTPFDTARKEVSSRAEAALQRVGSAALCGLVFQVEAAAAQVLR